MTSAIPKLPFQRVVREICDSFGVDVRWSPVAIGILQEVAEDFMTELFSDTTLLAAHAHRVTVMPKDFTVLTHLRFRYDKTLQPIPVSDPRTSRLLYIPPIQPEVEVEEVRVTHDRDTRAQTLGLQLDSQRRHEAEVARAAEEAELMRQERRHAEVARRTTEKTSRDSKTSSRACSPSFHSILSAHDEPCSLRGTSCAWTWFLRFSSNTESASMVPICKGRY